MPVLKFTGGGGDNWPVVGCIDSPTDNPIIQDGVAGLAAQGVSITLTINFNGAQIPLASLGKVGTDEGMALPSAKPGAAPGTSPKVESIAGRIDPAPETLTAVVEAWLKSMLARGKKPVSVKAFRQLVRTAAKDRGWRHPSDITYESVIAYMGAKREAGDWKGSSFNRALSAFRSLTRYMTRAGVVTADPLLYVDRADDDSGDGSRASTTDEARALIRFAWERQELDRRCKGDRALVWTCLYLMGLRSGEPEKFLWKHLHLEADPPFIQWTRDIQKNHKPAEVALCPEIVGLLLAHRATVPSAPEDLVFPVVPPRCTFRHDRDMAQISAVDSRGRKFSPHSARKWHATELALRGVHARTIDKLMRHTGGVEARYYDPPMTEQVAALAGLPALHPLTIRKLSTPQLHQKSMDLTSRGEISDTWSAKPIGKSMLTAQHNSTEPPASTALAPSVSQLGGPPRGAGGSAGLCGDSSPESASMIDPSASAENRLQPMDSTERALFGDLILDAWLRRLRGARRDSR